MGLMHWKPSATYTRQENFLMKRLVRTRELFGFLRAHRHELFDEAFESEFVSMYRDTGAGRAPVPPALLAMATLLQAYHGMSDAEAVEMTVVDLGGALYAPRARPTRRRLTLPPSNARHVAPWPPPVRHSTNARPTSSDRGISATSCSDPRPRAALLRAIPHYVGLLSRVQRLADIQIARHLM